MATPIRVVVLKDGDIFVAQCLEVDISAQGLTEEQALNRLRAVMNAEQVEAEANGKPLLEQGSAPQSFHAIFDQSSISRKEMKLVA